jgi:hypothetical protein
LHGFQALGRPYTLHPAAEHIVPRFDASYALNQALSGWYVYLSERLRLFLRKEQDVKPNNHSSINKDRLRYVCAEACAITKVTTTRDQRRSRAKKLKT